MKLSTVIILVALNCSFFITTDTWPGGQPWLGIAHFAVLWAIVVYGIWTDRRTAGAKHATPRRTHADDFRDKIARAIQRGRIAARIDRDTDPKRCTCDGYAMSIGGPRDPDCPVHQKPVAT